MKHTQHNTFTGPQTTPTGACHWAQKLVCLHADAIAKVVSRGTPQRGESERIIQAEIVRLERTHHFEGLRRGSGGQ